MRVGLPDRIKSEAQLFHTFNLLANQKILDS